MADLVRVYDADNAIEAELIREELEEAGIIARIDATPSPLDGLVSMGQGTPIYVHASVAEKATRIIEQFTEESPDSSS